MMGVPLAYSFLLVADIRKFWRANTLPAGYLFHSDIEDGCHNATEGSEHEDSLRDQDVWDLGDLTLQCGRRCDSLKLALGWISYGSSGYEAQINDAFDTAAHLATLIHTDPDLTLLSESPPPCLQVCCYFGGDRLLAEEKERNDWRTKEIARRLVPRGFMVYYAPGEFGLLFRVVVHLNATYTTVEKLVETVVEEGGRLEVDR
jgi:glutamate decarboxylase